MQESQSHLNSAAQSYLDNSDSISKSYVLSPRMRTASTSSMSPQLITPTPSPVISSTAAVSHPSLMERKAFSFFRALLVWNDILSCSTRKTKPVGLKIYRTLLTDEEFAQNLRDTIGCESWILVAILDATDLETWKQKQEAQGGLSIRELVSRAEKIESILEQGIEKVSTILQGLTPIADTTSNQINHSDRIQQIQTYIFAHSVLTYLHTIVSGSWPGVPEIQQSVSRTVSAWELLPSAINLKALAWPYCVSASLAVGPQRDIFRSLISEAPPKEPRLGSLVHLKSVVEECWRGFDGRKSERNVSCDWKEVMQRLDLSIVFA